MGLTSALSIGRTALSVYQAALQAAGQNLANIATPGYTRISPRMNSIPGANLVAGQLGGGVRLVGVKRNIDESIQARLRSSFSNQASSGTERDALQRIEGIFNPLGDRNLGGLLSEFFSSLGDLQNNPQDAATRSIVINTGVNLADRVHDVRTELFNLREDLNKQIADSVTQADDLATKIADLNIQITTTEAGSGGIASGLRDQRDQLLSELSEFFAITVKEQPNGAMNVYIGNESLVQYGENFGLKVEHVVDSEGVSSATVKFKINNGPVKSPTGSVQGLITARDTHKADQLARLDQLASALIIEINKIHSGGKGLDAFSQLTSYNDVTDSSLSLTTADNGLSFIPKSGSFFIDVKDANTGAVVRTQINIDLDGIGTDTSLDSLAADINANVPGVTATVLANGKLQLTAATGSTFSFSDDTSGVLAALGINTFFVGEDSFDIAVNPLLISNPKLLAAGKTDLPGDGANATAMAGLQDLMISSLGGVSLNDFYNSTMAKIAVSSSSAQSGHDAAKVISDSLIAQREAISGVNVDEEAVNMISYQRAYEGAARYMQVVDEMLQELLGLVR